MIDVGISSIIMISLLCMIEDSSVIMVDSILLSSVEELARATIKKLTQGMAGHNKAMASAKSDETKASVFCTANHTLISSSKGLERASVEAEDCEAKCVASSADLGEGGEEVPERWAVHDGVIDGASDEDSVAELRHLHSGQGEELFEAMGNINRA
ncbi:hypothetical protein TEA_009901 [Camellia sinensis var. sinensis]|uniref:Uncharacterized protein n=1 Tax=Camellia sinensis var. sinensis TaxID=542762 RepID=A0A4S4DPL2_CAMSN|nr:hypothetical protein TEA_009901 [Camellia sinensis var. sinensis]